MDSITIICGPTAVGKTAYAIERALKENAEIISADSGQIYWGLDIGTAKPNREERKGIPFHLIDILNPAERFNASDFRKLALEKIDEIQRRRRTVFIVGGTGLYIKVLEEGIFEGPGADPEIRKRLEERIKEEGIEALHNQLKKIDPIAASKMDGYNRQRIIRALEVYELTGRPISGFWKESQTGRTGPTGLTKLGLTLPRAELCKRIDQRIDRMIAAGWIDEVQRLLKQWGPEAPALKIIGYRELVSFLLGNLSREKAIDWIKIRTRQYAKRQMTWFRQDRSIEWPQIA